VEVRHATMIQQQGRSSVSDMTVAEKRKIHMFHSQGWSMREIARECKVSLGSVSHVINSIGERGDKRADRFEYLSEGGSSGCYENGRHLLTQEQLHANDPLEELIALETIQERMNGLKSND